jgi:hypothetical protein
MAGIPDGPKQDQIADIMFQAGLVAAQMNLKFADDKALKKIGENV